MLLLTNETMSFDPETVDELDSQDDIHLGNISPLVLNQSLARRETERGLKGS